jgi:hypothetical protein
MKRMRSSLLFAATLTAFGLIVMGGTEARAGYNATLTSVTPSGSNFVWTYAVQITASNESIAAGNFFRIYDFAGYVVGSGTVGTPGFTVTSALTNPVPPPNVILLHGDDPAILNVIFTYGGTTPITGPLALVVTLTSTFGAPTQVTKDFAGQSTNSQFGIVDTRQDIQVPSAVVPEPASILSAGVGLILLGIGSYASRFRIRVAV